MGADGEVTLRQRIVRLLTEGERTFDELRRELALPVGRLEDELQHVERSFRRGREGRLAVEPPRCLDCGFVFRDRAPLRFSTPSRCPRCRSERIAPSRLWIS